MEVYELMVCPTTESHPRYGEGAVLPLANGDLFMAYGEFYASDSGDMGAAHVMGRISRDRGRTWGDPYELVANDCITVFSVSLLRLPSGRILLGYLRKEAVGEGGLDRQGKKRASCVPWFRYSDDEGRTWSEPWMMDAARRTDYWVLNNDRLVLHASGRLLAPIAVSKPRGPSDPYHCSSTCVYSDDDGRTWTRSQTTLELEAMDGLQEPGLVELQDGSLMMFMRTSLGHQFRSVSQDRGETWSEAEPVPEFIAPVSPVSVKRIPSTGDLLAVFNKTYDPLGCPRPSTMGWRTPLTASLSRDDGKTWPLLRNIENDPKLNFDYVSITFLEDEEEVLLTYHMTKFFPQIDKHRRNLKLKILPVPWFYEDSGSGKTELPASWLPPTWPPSQEE